MSHALEQSPESGLEASAVEIALDSLRTDLGDCLSRDPERLFRSLLTDALRIPFYSLLAVLPVEEAARVLEWMAVQASPADAATLLLQAGLTPVGARLAAAKRRMAFERLLAPSRLALVLDLCRTAEAGELS